jgi:hypothetical protein
MQKLTRYYFAGGDHEKFNKIVLERIKSMLEKGLRKKQVGFHQ